MTGRKLNRYTGRDEEFIRMKNKLDAARCRVRVLMVLLASLCCWVVFRALREMPEVTRYWNRLTVCLLDG